MRRIETFECGVVNCACGASKQYLNFELGQVKTEGCKKNGRSRTSGRRLPERMRRGPPPRSEEDGPTRGVRCMQRLPSQVLLLVSPCMVRPTDTVFWVPICTRPREPGARYLPRSFLIPCSFLKFLRRTTTCTFPDAELGCTRTDRGWPIHAHDAHDAHVTCPCTCRCTCAHAREHRCDAESAARLHGDSAAGGVALQRLGRLTAAGDP